MNKLSLVGMQLPENIRRISTFRAKALRLELIRLFPKEITAGHSGIVWRDKNYGDTCQICVE